MVIRNQPDLFEGPFEIIDNFLGDDLGDDLWEMDPNTIISSHVVEECLQGGIPAPRSPVLPAPLSG